MVNAIHLFNSAMGIMNQKKTSCFSFQRVDMLNILSDLTRRRCRIHKARRVLRADAPSKAQSRR